MKIEEAQILSLGLIYLLKEIIIIIENTFIDLVCARNHSKCYTYIYSCNLHINGGNYTVVFTAVLQLK